MKKILARLHARTKGHLGSVLTGLVCGGLAAVAPSFRVALPFLCLAGSVALLAACAFLCRQWEARRAEAYAALREAHELRQSAFRSGASWASPAQLEALVRAGAPAYFAVEFVHERSPELPFGAVRVRLEEGASA